MKKLYSKKQMSCIINSNKYECVSQSFIRMFPFQNRIIAWVWLHSFNDRCEMAETWYAG